jgi:hypothetical protein
VATESRQGNVVNLNSVKREVSRHLRKKGRNISQLKLMKLKLTVRWHTYMRDLCRGFSDLKKGYQPRNNIVRNEKVDLAIDCHSILARWRNHFCQLFSVHGVSDVTQKEIHKAEPL